MPAPLGLAHGLHGVAVRAYHAAVYDQRVVAVVDAEVLVVDEDDLRVAGGAGDNLQAVRVVQRRDLEQHESHV